jgi:hypothetical protein
MVSGVARNRATEPFMLYTRRRHREWRSGWPLCGAGYRPTAARTRQAHVGIKTGLVEEGRRKVRMRQGEHGCEGVSETTSDADLTSAMTRHHVRPHTACSVPNIDISSHHCHAVRKTVCEYKQMRRQHRNSYVINHSCHTSILI